MKQQGRIVRKIDDSIVEIEIIPHETCHKCGACSDKTIKKMTFCGDEAENLSVGETVEVEAESGYLMFSYFIFYMIPLLCFFPLLFIVYNLTGSPLMSFVGGAFGMLIAYVIIGIFFRKHQKFSPHLKIRKI